MTSLALREARAVWTAAIFFTRLPLPALPSFWPEDQRRATAYWPFLGILTGAVIAAVWWLAAKSLPGSVAVGLSLAAGMLFTGALHEDGFADVCDGFGGGRTSERVLDIMRDSRLGAYGVIGLIMLIALKWQAMTALAPSLLPAALIAAHALSRGTALAIPAVLPYARKDGRPAHRMSAMSPARLAWGTAIAAPPLLLLRESYWPACIAASAVATGICMLWFHRRLGGYTGDCLGATQQVAELAILLAVLANT